MISEDRKNLITLPLRDVLEENHKNNETQFRKNRKDEDRGMLMLVSSTFDKPPVNRANEKSALWLIN